LITLIENPIFFLKKQDMKDHTYEILIYQHNHWRQKEISLSNEGRWSPIVDDAISMKACAKNKTATKTLLKTLLLLNTQLIDRVFYRPSRHRRGWPKEGEPTYGRGRGGGSRYVFSVKRKERMNNITKVPLAGFQNILLPPFQNINLFINIEYFNMG
jgi:hypothetical protein